MLKKQTDFHVEVAENGLILRTNAGDYDRIPGKAYVFKNAAEMAEFLDAEIQVDDDERIAHQKVKDFISDIERIDKEVSDAHN